MVKLNLLIPYVNPGLVNCVDQIKEITQKKSKTGDKFH